MTIEGTVETGKRLGHTLGFPTANIRPTAAQTLPANGVYACAFWVEGEQAARACMLNQGVHPTVPDGPPTIEAHLLDFSGDLYGRRVRVEYLHFLRPERRFDGLDALIAQLGRDRDAVRRWLNAARAGLASDPDAERAKAIDWIAPQTHTERS